MLSCLVGVLLSQGLAGTFTQMDGGVGHRLDFERNGRVMYQGLGDLAKVRLRGSFSITDGRLTVDIAKWSEKTLMPTQFQLVKWGPASYLLADEEIPHFLYLLRKEWLGEDSTFLKTGSLPSGEPELSNLHISKRVKYARIIHCAFNDEGPLNGGTDVGIYPGMVLKQVDGEAIAWVEDADRDMAYIRRLKGAVLRAGLKMEPSESPLRWRAEIQKLKKALQEKGGGVMMSGRNLHNAFVTVKA